MAQVEAFCPYFSSSQLSIELDEGVPISVEVAEFAEVNSPPVVIVEDIKEHFEVIETELDPHFFKCHHELFEL